MPRYSADGDKALMEAVLRQLDGKIDYIRLARDLGLESNKTAWKRWDTFKKRLGGGLVAAPKSPASTSASVFARNVSLKEAAVSPPTTPERTGKDGKQGRLGSKKRKRELSLSDDEDEDGDGGIKLGLGLKEGNGTGTEVAWDRVVQETPTRRMPARKARVLSFKEEASEAEDGEGEEEEEEEVEDLGHGSGHGGTEETEEMGGDFDEGEA